MEATSTRPLLLDRKAVAAELGISESKLDEERKYKRFPKPALGTWWTMDQVLDYVSQLQTYGGWDAARYREAMERRRERIAG